MIVRKTLFVSGFALLAFTSLVAVNQHQIHRAILPAIADGGDPMPNPYPPVVKGGKGTLTADGGDPMPNPYPKPPRTGKGA